MKEGLYSRLCPMQALGELISSVVKTPKKKQNLGRLWDVSGTLRFRKSIFPIRNCAECAFREVGNCSTHILIYVFFLFS